MTAKYGNPDDHHPDCDYRNSMHAREAEDTFGLDERTDVFDCNLGCMTAKYDPTPGPWVAQYGAVYDASGEVRLLLADREEAETRPVERDANVRLAAAAPDLLACLQSVACDLEAYIGGDSFDEQFMLEYVNEALRAVMGSEVA